MSPFEHLFAIAVLLQRNEMGIISEGRTEIRGLKKGLKHYLPGENGF